MNYFNQNKTKYPSPSISPWSQNIIGIVPQETKGATSHYLFYEYYGIEIAELRERVRKLEDLLEQKMGQCIIPIQFLESDKIELKQAIYVTLEYSFDDKFWIVDCPELNIYGSGRDEDEAIQDFKTTLEEKYLDLKQDKTKLGPVLQKEWSILTKFIQEK